MFAIACFSVVGKQVAGYQRLAKFAAELFEHKNVTVIVFGIQRDSGPFATIERIMQQHIVDFEVICGGGDHGNFFNRCGVVITGGQGKADCRARVFGDLNGVFR